MSMDSISNDGDLVTSDSVFVLGDTLSNSAFRGDPDADRDTMRRRLRAELRLPTALVVRHSAGRTLRDFVWADFYPLIHDRVTELFVKHDLKGWATYPVELYAGDGSRITGYQGLSITGRCQLVYIGKNTSEVFYETNPRGRFPRYRGLYFSRRSWDGSDFFMASDRQTDWRLVTDKVAILFKKYKVSNVRYESASAIETVATDQPKFLERAPNLKGLI